MADRPESLQERIEEQRYICPFCAVEVAAADVAEIHGTQDRDGNKVNVRAVSYPTIYCEDGSAMVRLFGDDLEAARERYVAEAERREREAAEHEAADA